MGRTTPAKRSVTGDIAGQEIQRLWGNMKVIDAKKDLRVFIAPEDMSGATKKHPAECILARACRRTFHATKVLFFRTVAYIDLPDSRGVRHVERFQMDSSARDLIAAFDRGEATIPEAGFELRVPRPSDRLDAKRERGRNVRVERQKLLGSLSPKDGHGLGQGNGKYRDKPLAIDMSVRSGTGAVHFRPSTQDA